MEFDKDLAARQEARKLARAAGQAQHILGDMSQAQLDAIVEAVCGFHIIVFVIAPEIYAEIVGNSVEICHGHVSTVLC